MSARARHNPSLLSIFSELLPAAMAVFLIAAAAIVSVTSRVLTVRLGYELSLAVHERSTLEQERAGLKLELATLKTPSRLEAEARQRFSLAPPPASSFMKVER